MDELEFRRRLFADPNDTEVIDHAIANPEQQSLVNELQDFDAQLKSALQVDVPVGLADRILEKQHNDEASNVVNIAWYRKYNKPFATAASMVLAVGIYFMSATNSPLQAGEHALEHVYYEVNALERRQEVALQVVNEKLAMFGAQFDRLPGKVTYATFCNFKGQKSLHLIFQSEHGPMTVFIVPAQSNDYKQENGHFSDERFAGVIANGQKADTILVANLGTPVEDYQTEINGALRWL
ncbi:hypothetical protein BGP78_13420 [Pseudoalteromonas sp. MSK9-3]|uniref:DUF3379 family protein n=1 Tax=Pseudoalteromonas sp. MSK9-3 TaxID=1897633 RepID=UPI000E6CFAD5|nr:DUF3379 family protein [Pseudoalteromonas sp. MSK9-3]RJE76401.1 hypothetical protein BGP78_13420 [Pseudoalteromonas sp. MSK9-3]